MEDNDDSVQTIKPKSTETVPKMTKNVSLSSGSPSEYFAWASTPGLEETLVELTPEEKKDRTVHFNLWAKMCLSFISPIIQKSSETGTIDLEEDLPFLEEDIEEKLKTMMEYYPSRVELADANDSYRGKAFVDTVWYTVKYRVKRGLTAYTVGRSANFVAPFILAAIARFYDSDRPNYQGFILVAIYIGLNSIRQLLDHYFFTTLIYESSALSCALKRWVFTKSLALGKTSKKLTSTGKLVNVLTQDAPQLAIFIIWGLGGFLAPVEIIVALTIASYIVGWGVFGMIAVVILLFMWTGFVAPKVAYWKVLWMKVVDGRSKFMSELLNGIKMFKLYGWETVLEEKVQKLRKEEERCMRPFSAWGKASFSVTMSAESLFVFGCISIYYAAYAKTVSLDNAIIVVGVCVQLKSSLTWVGLTLQQTAQTYVAATRFDNLLRTPEIVECTKHMPHEYSDLVVKLENASLTWRDQRVEDELATLEKLTKAKEAKLLGKEKAKEINEDKSIEIASKESFVGELHVDDNIEIVEAIPESELCVGDKLKITDVTDLTLTVLHQKSGSSSSIMYAHKDCIKKLPPDVFSLKNINLEIERGSLVAIIGHVASGKTSLIDAMMGEMILENGNIYMEDSTIGLVPQHQYIINATIRGNILLGLPYEEQKYLNTLGYSCLVEDLNSLSDSDMTEIGERGINLSGGQKSRVAIARALYQEADVYFFDDVLSALDPEVGDQIFQKIILDQLQAKTRVVVINSHLHNLEFFDKIIVIEKGEIVAEGSYDDLIDEFSNLMVTSEPHHEEPKSTKNKKKTTTIKTKKKEDASKLVEDEHKEQGVVRKEVWYSFFDGFYKRSGPKMSVAYIMLRSMTLAVIVLLPAIYLLLWAEDSNSELMGLYLVNDKGSLLIYGCIVITVISGVVMNDLSNTQVALNSTIKIHNIAFSGLLSAQLVFFDKTPIGQSLTRFTQDLGQADGALPWHWSATVWYLSFCLVGFLYNGFSIPWALIGVFVLLVVLYKISLLYFNGSRELKRLYNMAQSPITAHLEETSNGVEVIRSMKQQDRVHKLNNKLTDNMMRVAWTYMLSERWFSLRVVFYCYMLTMTLGILGIYFRKYTSPSLLTLCLLFTDGSAYLISYAIRDLINLANALVSVERLLDTRDSGPKEDPRVKDTDPVKGSWPNKGKVEFNNVSFRYREELPDVLKNLSFTVQPGEKIGICGHSGCGKSTIAMALFRMYYHIEGTIKIDGIDTQTLGTETLRGGLAIIPQDPVIMSGNMRDNLDPFHVRNDQYIMDKLRALKFMKHFVDNERDLLEYAIEEKGGNLSAGQRQLICIARAILKDAPVIFLDEATANIDAETDAEIQEALQLCFENKTVLTIAHRIQTISDSDKILLLSNGQIVEYDNPQVLRADPTSAFSRFVSGERIEFNNETKYIDTSKENII